MPITSKFLKDLRESAEADVPTHPSDAAAQIPDSLSSKKPVTENDEDSMEDDMLDMDENLESDVPTHPSDAAAQIPDSLKEEDEEEEKEDELAEEDEDEEDMELSEEEEEEKLSEEEEKEDELTEEDEDEEEKMSMSEEEESDEDEDLTEEEEKEDELTEEDEEENKLQVKEETDEDEELKEEDSELSDAEEKKMSEEEDEAVKEAADALTKDEELPESFKKKATAIFEAAIKRTTKKRVVAEKKKLVESYNKKLKTTKKKVSETLVNKIDGYLDYVVEEWMKENKVAIEGALRSEITENFISGLKNLFENHYIEVPAKKKNILAEQERKIKSLEKALNEQLNKTVEVRKENVRLKRATITKKLTEGMTVSDAAKFVELCEGVAFDNSKSFGQKLTVIKENYFPKRARAVRDIDASLLTEGGLKHEEVKPKATEVDVFADAISRMVKR
jgi:hypothetical protein